MDLLIVWSWFYERWVKWWVNSYIGKSKYKKNCLFFFQYLYSIVTSCYRVRWLTIWLPLFNIRKLWHETFLTHPKLSQYLLWLSLGPQNHPNIHIDTSLILRSPAPNLETQNRVPPTLFFWIVLGTLKLCLYRSTHCMKLIFDSWYLYELTNSIFRNFMKGESYGE